MIKPIAFAAALMAVSPVFAADYVLAVGQVSVLDPGAKIATVVVGDPAVAEVVVEGESTVLVLARKVGHTDIVMLDSSRQVLQTVGIDVASTSISDFVTVRRMGQQGVTEEHLACPPGQVCAKVKQK